MVATDGACDWRTTLAAVVARAPAELRARASSELHIGGFTNVRLEHPVLDLRGGVAEDLAARAVVFFVAAALLGAARVARVHVDTGAQGTTLARLARRSFKSLLLRVDDESVALVRYFDLYLQPNPTLAPDAAARLVRAVERALQPTR